MSTIHVMKHKNERKISDFSKSPSNDEGFHPTLAFNVSIQPV
jgi:hypothetical protein